MNTKTFLVILTIVIGTIAIISFDSKGTVNGISDINTNLGITISTNPNPLQPGPATFFIDIKDKHGKPVDTAKVSYNFNMTTMNMGEQQGDAEPQGNGRYSATTRISMRGPWQLNAKVVMPDGSVEKKDLTVEVP